MAHLKDKVSEKVQEAIFNQYLSKEGNNECADCGNRSPTWVSLDFGVYICIRCSGVHRQLGPHITRVRSTRLDAWQKGNIEIMGAVGNKLANEFYENRLPTGYRKPGANSTPEECRRFVDEKYIKKSFSAQGYQEPVKEFVSARDKGEKPNFGFTQEPQQEKMEVQQEKKRFEPMDGESNGKILRKKSMSLDKIHSDNHKHGNGKSHHQIDLLSADDDLLGGGNHPHTDNNEFGDFKEAHQTHSASPVKKINFANFKKANNNTPPNQSTQQDQQNHWAWDMSGVQQGNTQTQNASPNNNTNTNTNVNNTQSTQNQQQTQNVDVMKLYSQPTMHQNHFMQNGNMHHGGWHSQGWNNNNFQMGNMQQNFYQGGMGYQNGFGQQQQQQFNMGQNNHMNFNMGGQNMMYGHGQAGGFGQNNAGFVQAPMNKFY